MVHVRGFVLEPDAIRVQAASGQTERLEWGDAVAFVPAIHRTRNESVEKSSSQKFDLGRAAMSGGLMVTRKVTTTTKHASEEREPVLYVCR